MKSIVLSLFGLFLFCNQLSTQELSYYAGAWSVKYYQDNNEIEKKEFEELLRADTSAYDLWEKHKKQNTVATIFAVGQLGSFIWLLSDISNTDNNAGPIISTLAFSGLSIWWISKALKNKRNSVLTYNQNLDQKTSFKIEPSKTGLGIAISF